MPKTCRTCAEVTAVLDCYYQGVLSCDSAEICSHWRQGKTLLLVDALADVMAAILDALTGHWFVYTKLPGAFQSCESDEQKAEELIDRAYVLLARHKEEVGDDPH